LEKKQVAYDRVSPLAILAYTLKETIIEPLADAKKAKSLEEYLDKIEEMYRRANLEANIQTPKNRASKNNRTNMQAEKPRNTQNRPRNL